MDPCTAALYVPREDRELVTNAQCIATSASAVARKFICFALLPKQIAASLNVSSAMPILRLMKRIEFRVGINLGDVIVEDGDIFGDGVNVAARLEALAEPGGLCISRMVRDQIRDKLPYPFEDRGEQSVKNIAELRAL